MVSYLLLSAAAAAVVALVCLLVSRGGRLPPGPWGLPLLGYLPWLDPRAPHLTLTRLASAYGPVFGLRLGGVYTVVLSDAALVRDAFRRDVFTGRADLYLTHGIMQGYGIIATEGGRWKEQRKFAVGTLRKFGMVKVPGPQREQMENRILAGVKEAVRMLGSGDGDGLDPGPVLLHCLGNVFNGLLLGRTWPEQDPTWAWLRRLAEEGVKHIGVAGPLNFLPFLRWLPRYKSAMGWILEGKEATHRLYQRVLEEEGGKEGRSVGAAFLEGVEAGWGRSFTPAQGHHLIADLWGAGVDTTLATLRWLLLYVSLNPRIQAEVHRELDEVLSDREWPTMEDLDKMPLIEALICETQRIRSVVPLGIPHAALEETEIGGYRIPKRTMVLPLQWAIHMNPNDFKNPEEFDPYRFINDRGELDKPKSFIPFQTGKRVCLGEELARMSLFLFTVGILQRFRIGFRGDEGEALGGVCGITLVPGPHKLAFLPKENI